jgi:PKHD-type hydroxylase
MLLHLPEVLTPDEIAECRDALLGADWVDGRGTAGRLSAGVKHNLQLHWQNPVSQRLGALVTEGLQRNPLFLSAALPRDILPPLFNRYEGGGHYGPHLDGALREVDGTARRIRTDLSLTLALNDPADYDGGALVISDLGGDRAYKLPAGDAILYASSSIHHVESVTRGVRLACFTWIQSLVRDAGKRTLLLELDAAIQQLPENESARSDRLRFSNIYHNLLRRWTEL